MTKRFFLLMMLCFGMLSTPVFAQEDSEAEDLTDYKTACLAAIDNISLIGNNFAMRSMISVAKTTLNVCRTKDDMRRTMTALRAGVTSYLQTVKTFNSGQVFTGLVGNHSFDTGDLSLWYCLGFDLSQISLTYITNAMNGGDVSGLVNAVSVNEWNEDTKATRNEGDNAIQDGHQKYYLNSTQLMMQPIIGLPAGIYSFSALAACNPGFLKMNKVHLSALVVPTSIVQEAFGGVLSTSTNWEELFSNFDLQQYIVPFLQNGKLYSGSVNCKNLNTFSDAELRFIIDEGDIVIIGLNAGMVPFLGTDQFHADNIQLTGLRAADGILASAKADLAAALQGLEAVEANYNADLEGIASQPAFSYDKTLTENYNNAYLTAKDKYENDKLADILTKNDLNNLDGIDAAVKNHYSNEIQALRQAKDAFDRQAFIAPATDESFNILMKDDWVSLTNKWTGNAISIDEDMTMRFSQKPGQSVFALAFGFERTSNEYTNQLLAFATDYRNKYYLGEKDGNLCLTTDKSEAIIITAVPSYTEEGETHLIVENMYLGTSSSSNVLIATDEGTLLRPTRTGLSIIPASEMEFTVNIPEGWNASTLILPFDAELPEGINAYIVREINPDLPYIEGEKQTSLNANTPYVILADEAEAYTFCGVSHAILPAYEEGLLIGRFTPYTTQGSDEYKLTTNEEGFSVFCRTDGQPIAENECYLKCDYPCDIIFVSQADAVTGIREIHCPSKSPALYNLLGQRIKHQTQPHGIVIHEGKKIVLK